MSQYRRYSSSDRLKAVDFSLVESARRVIEGALSVVPGQKPIELAQNLSLRPKGGLKINYRPVAP